MSKTYAAKTTLHVTNDENILINTENARKLAGYLKYLDELKDLYEKACSLLPSASSSYSKRQKTTHASTGGDLEDMQDEDMFDISTQNKMNGFTNGKHDMDIDFDNNNNKNNSNNNNNNNSNNNNNNNNTNNNNNNNNNNSNNNNNTYINGINNNSNNNNTVDNINNNNHTHHDTKTEHKTRSQAKKKRREKLEKIPMLDTSLLRPVAAHPELTIDTAERVGHSIGHLVNLANLLRLRAGAAPFFLSLASKNPTLNVDTDNPTANNNVVTPVQRRPFLNESDILKYQRYRHVFAVKYKLQDGDVIHMPFTKEEHDIAESLRKQVSFEEWPQKLSERLPGRTVRDCQKYVKWACENGNVVSINQPIIYREYKTNETVEAKNVLYTLKKREYDQKLTTHRTYVMTEMRKKQAPLFRKVSASSECSGATTDVKFDPTGLRDKLLVGCAWTETRVSTAERNIAIVYNLKSGQSTVLNRHEGTVIESQFSIDGNRMITAGEGKGVINVWDTDTGEFIIDLVEAAKLPAEWIPTRFALHHTDPHIITSCSNSPANQRVYVWRMSDEMYNPEDVTFANLTSATILPGGLHEMDFSKGIYSHLVVGATSHHEAEVKRKHIIYPGWAVVFDINAGTYLRHATPHLTQVSCVRTSRCGSMILTGGMDGYVAITDIRTCEVVKKYRTWQPDVTVCTWSPCGNYITSGGEDNQVFVYDSRYARNPVHVLKHEPNPAVTDHDGVSCSVWSNYGSLLITGGEDNAVRIWDVRLDQPQLHVLRSHSDCVSTVAISRNDQLIASGGLDNKIFLHSQDEGDIYNPAYKISKSLISETSNA